MEFTAYLFGVLSGIVFTILVQRLNAAIERRERLKENARAYIPPKGSPRDYYDSDRQEP